MRPLLACLCLAACSGAAEIPEPAPLVAVGQACTQTIECAKGLHCSDGVCAEPASEAQRRAVDIATLERKIAATHRHEAKAFTEDGKRRMRKERAELEAKLAALKAG